MGALCQRVAAERRDGRRGGSGGAGPGSGRADGLCPRGPGRGGVLPGGSGRDKAHLDLALEIDPRLAGAHYLYGALWLRESEYSRAANAFLQAMLEEPTSPESHFSLGRVLMSMRRNQIASNLMQQAEGVQQLLDRKYPPPNK